LPAPNFAGAKRSCGAGVPPPAPSASEDRLHHARPKGFVLKYCLQEAGQAAALDFFIVEAARGRASS